ncbi:MAG: hypothetical protein IPP29_24040 [Bacteroidetes bacterium]|nr:hypothetical protein [Bacteroidota bacterium]
MKKYILLLITILLLHIHKSQAQYVTIPDTNFVTWLNANGYASCMNGNMIDTTCGAVVNATSVDCNGAGTPKIMDLTGIQFFDNLQDLDCSEYYQALPPNLPNALIN